MSTDSTVYRGSSPLIMLIYLVSKALCQVKGTFHLLIGWQIWVDLLPNTQMSFQEHFFFFFFKPGFGWGNSKLLVFFPPALPQLNNDMRHLPWYLRVQLEALLHEAIASPLRGRWKAARLRRSLTIWPLMETSSAVLEWRLQKKRKLEPTAFVSVAVPACVCASVSHLGDMLTSRIQGLRFSSNMMSKPNSSWQLYGERTFVFSKLRT